EIHVSAGLVGFGFEGELVVKALRDVPFAEEVDGFAEAFDGVYWVFGGVGFGSFAAAPEDVNFCAELSAVFHGAHGFLNGEGADAGIVAGKSAVLEDRIGEEIGGCHGAEKAVVLQILFELLDDLVGLLG